MTCLGVQPLSSAQALHFRDACMHAPSHAQYYWGHWPLRGDLQINSGSAPSGPWSLSHVPAGEQLVDNGVFHHRRSIGPSAASAKTCSTGCSMVQSSLAQSKKMRALYTVHIGFNTTWIRWAFRIMSPLLTALLATRPLQTIPTEICRVEVGILLENDCKHSRLSHSLLLGRHGTRPTIY